jgi:hypothetical protein
MILRNEKIIFIHIPKNAGQSIEAFFGRKWTPSAEARSKNPEMWPERFQRHTPWTRYERVYKTHTYRAFAIIRNPWSRIVSSYTYEQKMAQKGIGLEKPNRKLLTAGGSFEDYVRNADRDSFFVRPQAFWLRNAAGQIATIDLLRFENLAEEFQRLARKYNLKDGTLPHINRSTTGHKHYSEYYTTATRKLVTELYAEDIELFGYSFEDAPAHSMASVHLPSTTAQTSGI